MIIDRLENLEKYVSLHPLFAQVLDYLKSAELETHEMGVEHLKDKELFVTFAEAAPKTDTLTFRFLFRGKNGWGMLVVATCRRLPMTKNGTSVSIRNVPTPTFV